MSYKSVWLSLKVHFPFLSYLSVHENNIQLYDQKKFVHVVEKEEGKLSEGLSTSVMTQV